MKTLKTHELLKLLFWIFCLFPALPLNASTHEHKYYTIGVVPQFEARRLHSVWHPILEELEKRTGYRFELKGAPTIAEFEKAFMHGDYDLAYMNPYHYIVANQTQGYLPLVRDTAKKLFGVLVVNQQSDISRVEQLDGKTIAFPSPNALGAALQMRQELHDIFNIKFNERYVKTHDSVYLNVILNQTSAGGGVQKTLNRQPENYRNALKVIHKTKPVAPHPVVIHPRVPEAERTIIQQALVAFDQREESRKLLLKVPMKKVGIAIQEDYAPLLDMKLERFYVKPK